ncbi:MAG: hypothetical protein E7036_09690 [Opitutales bacterium]|nr:hypothetical protein [Opitutales bacterium]
MYNPEKARYISEETLGKIGEAIENPLFIEQSATIPQNAIVVHTDLEHNGKKLGVAIHLSKEQDGYVIHNIASVYSRSQSQKDRVLTESRLLYLNTQKGLSEFSRSQELQLPRPENLKNLFVNGKVLTQDNLSQENSSLKAKYDETRSQEELDELNAKFRDLYEQYKNTTAFEKLNVLKQAMDLVKAEAERKGYVVEVYHGTGADGFNVADATSSYEENGEGNQAHGAGLYMAVSRDTARGYRDKAVANAKEEMLSHLKIKGLPLSDILNWKILVDENQEVLKIMFSEMVNTPYIFSFDEYIEIQNDWVKKSNDDYDRAVHNQAKEAIETVKKAFKEKGIRTDDVSFSDTKGSFFNWFTNLNEDNTLDVDSPLTEQGESVRKAIFEYYKSRPDDYIAPKDIDDLNKNQDGERFYKDVIFQMRREGASNPKLEASKLLAKLGIKGLTYDGRQDGRCYVSFEGGATVKLQDPFTFDDNGNLIPLTERFNENNPDMRWKFDEEMPLPEDIIEATRQYDEIVAKYKGTPQWMKAPNGEPTKLTEEQWVMVRAPNFKKWFGDWENDPQNASKVVDENGEPLVVYHGTKWNALKEPQGKAIFDIGKSGKSNDNISKIGFWFTPSKIIADDFSYNWYGNGEPEILDVFLNLKNPKIYREVDNSEELSKVKKEIENAKNDIKKIEKETPRLNQLLGLVPRKTFYETEDEYNKAVENYFKTAEGYLFEKSDAENAIEFIKLKEKLDLLHFDRRVLENSDSYDQFRNDLDEFSDYKYQSISKGVISYKRGSHLSNFAIYNTNEAVEKLKNKLLNEGYDGVIVKDTVYDAKGHGVSQYVAFEPNQIKSATDNVGTFSQSNDIRWKVDAKAEADAWASNPENLKKATDEYLSKQKGQIIVDPDEIRKLVPNYDVSNNSLFTSAGDKILEVVWAEALKKAPKDKPVVLLTGNPAAGKGTAKERGFLKRVNTANLVFDAPQNSFKSVEKRVKEAIDAGHNVFLIQIYNDPITSWENSLKRGIEKGRFLPLAYFLRVYERAGEKVSKIEGELKSRYGEKIDTFYIDSRKNNPIVVSPKEALAWDYSISDEQLKQIENITYEYKGRIEESTRNRKDKSNPLTVITNGLREINGIFVYRNVSFGRIVPEGISRRDKQSDERNQRGVERQGKGEQSRLKSLLRQERSENPVYWASIVLAKEILRGRAINGAKLEKVLPSEKFDGTQRQYAIDRAKLIAEQCKATQDNYINRLDQAVKLAENDVYWTRDIVHEMNNSFRRDGEEYGIVRQKLTQWLKDEQRKDLEKVKGLTSGEIGIDVADAIENALEAEPERKKADATPVEETNEEISDDAEEGIDNELVGTIEKLAPSNIRDIITQVRVGVLKVVKRKNGDEQMRRRLYRNTLVEVLREATKRLTYGKEREAIFTKISELATKGYAVIKIKDGERAGQKIDNYTLRAEHIALRIFNRGVRDTKEALLEKFDKLLKHAKAPARIKRDDKRKMTGKSEERAYIIKQIAYMPLNSDDKTVKSVESEIENTLAVINKADSTMANDYHAKLINAVQYLEDLQRFGALKEKSRAEMAEAIEWIEKFLEDETQSHAEKVEKLKADADHRRKIFIDAINQIKRNASFDSKTRAGLRQLINTSSTFKDLLLGLGRSATGRVSAEFRQLVEDMMNDCYSATTQKENEIFRLQNEFTEMVKEIYGMNEADVFKHLLGRNDKHQEFSIQGKPMSVQVALQRLSMAEQVNYEHNVYIHCCGRSQEARAIEQRIDELEAIEEKTKEIRTEIKELEMRLETIERNSVREYADKLRSALSNEDLKLLDWFRDFYKRERESLSNANEVITGLGVPESDPFYTPMKMLREGGTNEKHQVVAIVPKSLSPRVPNSLDMDEDFGIVDIWSSRISENAHYKAFSQLNIEWRGIFAHADFHKAVNAKLGKDVLSQMLDHFNDIMSVNLVDNHKVEWIDKLNGFFAIASLGYNFGSGVRQTTGTPAFANFVGAKNVMQYAMSCLSSEGRKAMLEILKSETAQRRMQSGNNQVLVEALNNLDENKFWAWYKRNAMVFNRWGDILPIMTIGQGIYRAKTEEYAKSMPIESAKKRAMDEMWAIAEASQQSPSVMNMGLAQRRLGTAGRTLSLFTSSPQLMLSREVEAVNRFISVRTKYTKNPKDETTRKDYIEARNNLAKTLFVNHILVQGGYMLATMLWKAVLGDDWDDDDIYALLAEVIAGPFGGLIVFGRFVSATYSTFNTSVAPISGLGNTVGGIIDFIPDLLTLDYEEVAKDIDKIGKSLFAPYRDVRKVYQNATDKKEGTIW